MGLFKNFSTDKNLEVSGVVYTPDTSTAITLARAGGANMKFQKELERVSKPMRRQIEAGIISPEMDRKMIIEVYATAVILNWETLVDANSGNGEADLQLVVGIEADPENLTAYQGEPRQYGDTVVVPFNKHNVMATLTALPDLFTEIQAESRHVANYRAEQKEADTGN